MNARSIKRVKSEIEAWAADTRLLLGACRRLIEYFGTDKELKSWDAAIGPPLEWIAVGLTAVSAGKRRKQPAAPDGSGVVFRCTESTATVLSPLVEIVGGPIAKFVLTIRRLVPQAEQRPYIVPYGFFCVSFADAVTQRLWKTYRHLAPDEWKTTFSARPDNRALQRTALARRR